jgi:hypothetical protein
MHPSQSLLKLARGQYSNLLSHIQSIQTRNVDLQIVMSSKLNQLLVELRATSKARGDSLGKQYGSLKELSERLLAVVTEGRAVKRNQAVVDSLYFSTLKQRRQTIPDAYQKTLEWLYDPSRTNLSTWLRNESGIYWINGQVSFT